MRLCSERGVVRDVVLRDAFNRWALHGHAGFHRRMGKQPIAVRYPFVRLAHDYGRAILVMANDFDRAYTILRTRKDGLLNTVVTSYFSCPSTM